MACPLCGDRCTCSSAPSTARAGASAPPSLTYEYDDDYDRDDLQPAPALACDTAFMSENTASPVLAPAAVELAALSGPVAPPEDLVFESARLDEEHGVGVLWKQEVASRLENYRARRGSRRPRYNANLSLDFDRAVNRMINSALAAEELAQAAMAPSTCAAAALEPDDEGNQYFGSAAAPFSEEAEPTPAPAPVTNVLEFPRLPTLFDMAPSGSELAEPVIDKPRILYVPEEVPTAQAPLADIQINPDEPPPIPDLQLPIAVAPMGQRVFAAFLDGFIILAAAVMFLAIVLQNVPAPDTKVGYMLVAALPVAFWAIYEYLFLVHCAATPGMKMTHLAVRSFDRQPAGRRLRRARALACMLSAFPLGLGILWALLDEDTLCWHDRITRTYLVVPTPQSED